MTEPLRPGIGTRITAFFCRICLICIPARRWPESNYARRIRVIQDICPFCRARVKVKRFEQSRQEAVAVRS